MAESKNQNLVTKTATAKLPTQFGEFQIIIYTSSRDNLEYAVLVRGILNPKEPVLTRIHSQCFTGDTLLSLRCDCREQLHKSMQMIAENGTGIIIYLNQEGRGIGLGNKIKAYAFQDEGLDTVEANHKLGFPNDTRDYLVAADILDKLEIADILLLTNNPNKIEQLKAIGINVVKRIPLIIPPNEYNKNYLMTKKQKLGHLLDD